MTLTKQECFEILGVSIDADESEVRTAYKKLALLTHPDKNKDDPESHKKFLQISEAYKRITDPDAFKDEDENDGSHATASEMEAMFEMMFSQMFASTSRHSSGKHGVNMFDMMEMMMAHDHGDYDSEEYDEDDSECGDEFIDGLMAAMLLGGRGFRV